MSNGHRWDVGNEMRQRRVLERLGLRCQARDQATSAQTTCQAADSGNRQAALLSVARYDSRVERHVGQEQLQARFLEALRDVRQIQRGAELAIGLFTEIH